MLFMYLGWFLCSWRSLEKPVPYQEKMREGGVNQRLGGDEMQRDIF